MDRVTRHRVALLGALGVAAALPTLFGRSLSDGATPFLRPTTTGVELQPWDPSWGAAPLVTVKCPPTPDRRLRFATVRAQRSDDSLFLLVEWRDRFGDMGFEGAYYPSAVNSAEPLVQETTLLRDSLTLWLGGDRFSSTGAVLAGAERGGRLVWTSQWQSDFDRNFMASVKKKSGTPVVDFYQLSGDGAYPARFVGNSNAILAATKPCRWIVEDDRSVVASAVERSVEGYGKWRDGKWRVVFRLPITEMDHLGDKIAVALAVTDGSASEWRDDLKVSQAFYLLPGRARGNGKVAKNGR